MPQTRSSTNGSNSAYEVGIVGADTFGIKGLGLRYFTNKADADVTTGIEFKGTHYGASYAMGQFAIGAEKHVQNRNNGDATTDVDQTSKTIGGTFAVSPTVTLGLTHVKTDISTAIDEKVTSLSVGYNLGPVALVAIASKAENIGINSGRDANELNLRLTTAF